MWDKSCDALVHSEADSSFALSIFFLSVLFSTWDMAVAFKDVIPRKETFHFVWEWKEGTHTGRTLHSLLIVLGSPALRQVGPLPSPSNFRALSFSDNLKFCITGPGFWKAKKEEESESSRVETHIQVLSLQSRRHYTVWSCLFHSHTAQGYQ